MSDFPKNWFWIVGGDESKAWSSAACAYVAEYPSDRATRIANEIELYDVLAKNGAVSRAPPGPFSVEQIREALLRIDASATGEAGNYEELAEVAAEIEFILPSSASDP
ncbi:hypothetical protein [Hyphomicrobium sp. 99]|uniref:hypothetical protein n=1 Tax=Hyphomicrobium sp. 99 TaxID=1163419 RepID=UPI0005F891B3|nr:hypothetical protein [Hyphomicrobium sp. 99]